MLALEDEIINISSYIYFLMHMKRYTLKRKNPIFIDMYSIYLKNSRKTLIFPSVILVSPLNNSYEINRRIVFVMRLLGIAREEINIFCNLMDIVQGINRTAYTNIVQYIQTGSKAIFEILCKKAIKKNKKKIIKMEDLQII